MKAIALTLAAAAAITAVAAPERIASISVADSAALAEASGKIGQMTASPMAAVTLSSALANLPTTAYFGPGRAGTPTTAVLFADFDKIPSEAGGSLDAAFDGALLYPVTLSKEDFAKLHPGASAADGVLTVPGNSRDPLVFDKCGNRSFVAFSEDGAWAAIAKTPGTAKLALGERGAAATPLEGKILEVKLERAGVNAIMKLAKAAQDDVPQLADYLSIIDQIACVKIGVKVSDLGIDFLAALKLVDGAELSKCGLKPLEANPFAFAGKNAVSAIAEAENSGSRYATDSEWAVAMDLVKLFFADPSTVLVRNVENGVETVTIDFAPIVERVNSGEPVPDISDEMEKLAGKIEALKQPAAFKLEGPAIRSALAIKGFESQWTVQERFDATIPEAAGKKPYCATFMSLTSVLKALTPHIVKMLPEEQRATLAPALSAMVVEAKAGIASASWREGEIYSGVFRISADELRSIGGLVNMLVPLCMGMGGESMVIDVEE